MTGQITVELEIPTVLDWFLLANFVMDKHKATLDDFRCNESIDLMRKSINNVMGNLMVACIKQVHGLDSDVEKIYLAVVYDKGKRKLRIPDPDDLT